MNFKTAGTPPISCKSSIRYFPLGFKFPRNGVSLDIFWKSSIPKSIFAVLQIAKICNTAFVDPPKTVINLTAFSIDFLVIISLGFISFLIKFKIELAIIFFSFDLSLLTAGFDELYGSDIPIASIADDMVLAVYIPPQAPGPGQALLIILS